MYATAEPVPEDAGRLELVRTEIDTNDVPIGANEVIAEYAVDMRFGATVDQGAWTPGQTPLPNLLMRDVGDPLVYNWLRSPSSSVGTQGAERVKSVRVRLSVRSREADRDAAVPPATTLQGFNGGIYRFRIGNKFARVRNLQADVALLNQQGLAF